MFLYEYNSTVKDSEEETADESVSETDEEKTRISKVETDASDNEKIKSMVTLYNDDVINKVLSIVKKLTKKPGESWYKAVRRWIGV